MSERYAIGTLADMAKIPEEALPRFISELPHILQSMRNAASLNEMVNSVTSGALGICIKDAFWTDDGECTGTVTIKQDEEEIFKVTTYHEATS